MTDLTMFLSRTHNDKPSATRNLKFLVSGMTPRMFRGMTQEGHVDRQDWLQQEDGWFRDRENTRQLASQTISSVLENTVAEATLDKQHQCSKEPYLHSLPL